MYKSPSYGVDLSGNIISSASQIYIDNAGIHLIGPVLDVSGNPIGSNNNNFNSTTLATTLQSIKDNATFNALEYVNEMALTIDSVKADKVDPSFTGSISLTDSSGTVTVTAEYLRKLFISVPP